MSKFIPQGMGWIPDLPDARDYTYRDDAVLPLLRQLKRSRRKTLPSNVDLRRDDDGEYFTPPEDQGPLNCSAACAVLGLVEYFERRVRGRTFEGSKLFLYKATRNRLQKRLRVTGDTGARAGQLSSHAPGVKPPLGSKHRPTQLGGGAPKRPRWMSR